MLSHDYDLENKIYDINFNDFSQILPYQHFQSSQININQIKPCFHLEISILICFKYYQIQQIQQIVQMVKVTVLAANNKQYQTNVDLSITGYQLREHIFNNVVNTLGVNEMKIMYAGVAIQNDKQLSFYKIAENGANLKIIQTKAGLQEIVGLIVAYEQDPITLEEKTCRMPCGHVIGRDCMTLFLRSLISSKKYEIKCPSFKPDGRDCQALWQYKLCRTVGVLTQQEKTEFQEGLSKNWMQQFTATCPKCQYAVYKGQLQSNRVICPSCGFGDFCFSCLHLWIAEGMTICGNQQCKYLNQLLKKCPWDRKFNLSTNGVMVDYMLPKYRACPTCHTLIEHKQACKHMECPICQKGFCWICLAVSDKGQYPCGAFNNYCGKISPTQQIEL